MKLSTALPGFLEFAFKVSMFGYAMAITFPAPILVQIQRKIEQYGKKNGHLPWRTQLEWNTFFKEEIVAKIIEFRESYPSSVEGSDYDGGLTSDALLGQMVYVYGTTLEGEFADDIVDDFKSIKADLKNTFKLGPQFNDGENPTRNHALWKALCLKEEPDDDDMIKLYQHVLVQQEYHLRKAKAAADKSIELSLSNSSHHKSLQLQMDEKVSSLKATIDRLKASHGDEIARLQDNHKEAINRLKVEHGEKINRLKANHGEEINRLQNNKKSLETHTESRTVTALSLLEATIFVTVFAGLATLFESRYVPKEETNSFYVESVVFVVCITRLDLVNKHMGLIGFDLVEKDGGWLARMFLKIKAYFLKIKAYFTSVRGQNRDTESDTESAADTDHAHTD